MPSDSYNIIIIAPFRRPEDFLTAGRYPDPMMTPVEISQQRTKPCAWH
jgi:hypothetical protein